MKRYFVLILLGLCVALLSPRAASAADDPLVTSKDWAITDLTFEPTSPRAGDPVVFMVTLSPSTTVTTTDTLSLTVTLHAFAKAQNNRNVAGDCSDDASGAIAKHTQAVTLTLRCRVVFPVEGSYQLAVTLTQKTAEKEEPISSLPQRSFVVSPYATALPDQVARLFASFGLFAAIMVVMALATEVVIDNLKVALGLKSKVTAMEAFKDMEQLLPGKLANLGVDAAEQERVQKIVDNVTKTLKVTGNVSAAAQAVAEGKFAAALAATGNANPAIAQTFQTLAAEGLAMLKTAISKLSLPAEQLEPFLKEIERILKTPLSANAADNLNAIAVEAQALGGQLLVYWFRNMVGKSEQETLSMFKDKLIPVLKLLGWASDDLTFVQEKLENTLKTIVREPLLAAQTYVDSLKELLQGVEERRNDTQSPLRKLWRRWRESEWGEITLSLSISALIALFLQTSWGKNDFFDMQPKENLATAALIISFLINLVLMFFPMRREFQRSSIVAMILFVIALIYIVVTYIGPADWPQVPSFLSFMISFVIIGAILWNLIHGLGSWGVACYLQLVKDNKLPPKENIATMKPLERCALGYHLLFGARPSDSKKYGLTYFAQADESPGTKAESAAKMLLMQSDKHRDEESSRLRWLRVLSVLVGAVLAYLLQVDATAVIATVIPGISDVVNSVVIRGTTLHNFWHVLDIHNDLTPGIILTGLAASAGSAFWHDQLDRLQATKNSAEQAMALVNKVKGLGSGDRNIG